MADLDRLKEHLQVARTIIDERGLYDIWENVPKSEDPDFKGNSFEEAVRQGVNFKVYDEWTATLEDLFFANRLDYLRFKGATLTGDSRKANKLPAAVFVRKVKELERIIDNPAVLDIYRTAEKQAASWPPISYTAGVVKQGSRTHTFTQPAANRLLEKIWKNRRIETSTGQEVVSGKSIERDKLNQTVGFNDHQRFVDVVTGIHKSMRAKGIHLNVKYPDRVLLVVRQNDI